MHAGNVSRGRLKDGFLTEHDITLIGDRAEKESLQYFYVTPHYDWKYIYSQFVVFLLVCKINGFGKECTLDRARIARNKIVIFCV